MFVSTDVILHSLKTQEAALLFSVKCDSAMAVRAIIYQWRLKSDQIKLGNIFSENLIMHFYPVMAEKQKRKRIKKEMFRE